MTGRVLAIGDIHGCDTALESILKYVKPTREDTVVSVGDLVDRGPDSKRVVEMLMELRQQCDFVLVKGNHEEMLEYVIETGQSLRDWLIGFGGGETLESYGCSIDELPADHVEFLTSGVEYHETETHIFAHATPHPHAAMPDQERMDLRWSRFYDALPPHISGKQVICGHTAQKSGKPALADGWVCIDTWVYGDGALTCLDVISARYCQANERGQLQEWIDLP